MKNELKINGTQNFMGINIPVIEGGFGENCRVITAKTVAEIHKVGIKRINELINNNIRRFKKNIDIIDIISCEDFKVVVNDLGLKGSNRTKNVYLLSERGYAKLIKIMNSDKAWEVHDKLIDEYFSMRKELNSNKQKKAMLLLTIYDGGQAAIVASKELSKIEVEEATAPLIPKAEYHDAVEVASNCVNFGKFSANLQNNEGIKLGRNTIMDWCRDKGYLCSSIALKNKPSQQMLSSGYMQYKQNITERNGNTYINYTPLLTGKGEIWLTKQFLKDFC